MSSASPKSMSRMEPAWVNTALAGLTSRWQSPAACSAASASSSGASTRAAASGSGTTVVPLAASKSTFRRRRQAESGVANGSVWRARQQRNRWQQLGGQVHIMSQLTHQVALPPVVNELLCVAPPRVLHHQKGVAALLERPQACGRGRAGRAGGTHRLCSCRPTLLQEAWSCSRHAGMSVAQSASLCKTPTHRG